MQQHPKVDDRHTQHTQLCEIEEEGNKGTAEREDPGKRGCVNGKTFTCHSAQRQLSERGLLKSGAATFTGGSSTFSPDLLSFPNAHTTTYRDPLKETHALQEKGGAC